MEQRFIIKTARVGLRRWQSSDANHFIDMNQDVDVMQHFPWFFTPEESLAGIQRFNKSIGENGFSFFAAEHLETGEFMGFVGIDRVDMEIDICPCVEIGWRLRQKFWNKGYATEAAKASLQFGFEQYSLDQIYAWTALDNQPSVRVMEKIGMSKIGEFDHPKIHKDHATCPHHLYLIKKDEFSI